LVSGSNHQISTFRFGIGVDYGTSNSAAAIYDGEKVHLVQLEHHSKVMPSATYIDRDFQIVTGQAAINSYIESNTGRTVELSAEVIGEARTTTGQIGDRGLPEEANSEKIYGQSFIDGGQKGRLFRGIKRLLGNSSARRLMVFDRPFRLVALITPLLVRIRHSTKTLFPNLGQHNEDINHACIGHPVNFEGTEKFGNQMALRLLSEAYGYAEFTEQSYYPEPIAAALSYLHDNPEAEEQTLLAVDFGGGTLDLCVLTRKEQEFSVIATHGVGLGGDDYEDFLLNWAVSYMLNQNKYTTPLMQRMAYDDEAAVKFRRLYDLIKNNYSYLVFQCLKDLKATLSSEESAILDIPELDIELEVTRVQFEEFIQELLDKFQRAISDLLNRAGLQSHEIQLVIRTGGSSLIPAVKRILDEQFAGKVVEHDPFSSVAAGLAIAEYRNLGQKL